MANPLADLSSHLADAVARIGASVAAVRVQQRTIASGIVWRPGVIVTAAERIDGAEEPSVVLPGGESHRATLAGSDLGTDVAVLRCEQARAAAPPLAPAESVRPGGLVLAVGRYDQAPLAALGVIATSSGPWTSLRGGTIDRMIRLDLALPSHAEGAFVADAEGALVGMAVLGPRRRALVIPAATIARIAEQILARGTLGRGYVGLGLHPVRTGAGSGAIVVGLDPDGPAHKAGVLLGDVVVAWDGAPVSGMRDLRQRLGSDSVGRTVELDLVRAGAAAKAKVTIGERRAG